MANQAFRAEGAGLGLRTGPGMGGPGRAGRGLVSPIRIRPGRALIGLAGSGSAPAGRGLVSPGPD
jgi:hypothetical protein